MSELVTTTEHPAEVVQVEEQDGLDHLQVIARYPYQMEKCQQELVGWCGRKIEILQAEAADLAENLEIARTNKWGTGGLHRAHARTIARIDFYRKMQAALEAGYCIVPNFPVEMFAIRTDRRKPAKMLTPHFSRTHEQQAMKLPVGEGEFKNPFPSVYFNEYEMGEGKKEKWYFAKDWQEMEFPFVAAKPQILDATARALADKVFDEIGVLPGKRKRQDPIVVGRTIDPRSNKWNKIVVTFLIAWWVDTRAL